MYISISNLSFRVYQVAARHTAFSSSKVPFYVSNIILFYLIYSFIYLGYNLNGIAQRCLILSTALHSFGRNLDF